MSNSTKGSGAPKRYSSEFKTEAVQMVLDGGLTKAEVSRRLGVTATISALVRVVGLSVGIAVAVLPVQPLDETFQ